MSEHEDRGDNLDDVSANPFVGGDGETNDAEAEDRGDTLASEDGDATAEGGEDSTEETVTADADGASASGDSGSTDGGDGDAGDDSGDGESADDEVDETPATPMIPKKRFDAVNDRMKAAERRLEELERMRTATEQATEEEFDFDAKEKEYMEAVLDGDSDQALALRKEIRAAETAQFEAKANSVEHKAVERTKLEAEFDDAISVLEGHNAVLNPDDDAFDEALVDEIVALQGGLLAGGDITPGAALLKAAGYVMGNKLVLEEASAEESPEPAPKPKKPLDVKAKIAAAGKQPANLNAGDASSSAGEGVINVNELTEKEFDSLPESKKRELRGDVI